MEDQAGGLSQLKTQSDAASKSIDALTESLNKMAGVKGPAAAEKESYDKKVASLPSSPERAGGSAGSTPGSKGDAPSSKADAQQLKQKQAQEIKEIEAHEKRITNLKKNHQKERLSLVKQASAATISEVSSNLQALAGHHKGFGAAAKAAMIADATMKTYSSAIGAYDQAMGIKSPFGLVAAPIAAALAVGAGMMNVSKIAAQKFEKGGPVDGPSHAMGGVLAELEGGEYVVPRRTVARMGGMQAVQGTLDGASSRPRVSSTLNITVNGKSGSGQGSGPSSKSGGSSLINTMRAHQNKSRLAGAYRITG